MKSIKNKRNIKLLKFSDVSIFPRVNYLFKYFVIGGQKQFILNAFTKTRSIISRKFKLNVNEVDFFD